MPPKLKSRKFWLSQQILLLSVGVPLAFAKLQIDASVTLATLGLIGAVGALYGVTNVLAKRYSADE